MTNHKRQPAGVPEAASQPSTLWRDLSLTGLGLAPWIVAPLNLERAAPVITHDVLPDRLGSRLGATVESIRSLLR